MWNNKTINVFLLCFLNILCHIRMTHNFTNLGYKPWQCVWTELYSVRVRLNKMDIGSLVLHALIPTPSGGGVTQNYLPNSPLLHVTQHRGEHKERNSTNKIKDCYSGLQSVQFSCLVMFSSLWPHRLQHARPSCPSPTPGVYSNSCPSSGWCHPTISSSVIPFSSHLQSFPESGSFQRSQFFSSGGQSIGVSAST